MAKIIAPTAGYNGISAGVTFQGGVGHTDNENVIAWFRRKGYAVIDVVPAAPPDLPPVPDAPAAPPDPPPAPEIPAAPSDPPPAPEIPAAPSDPPPAPEIPAAPSDPPPVQQDAGSQQNKGPDPLEKMTMAELKAYAAEKGIDISGIVAKSNILAKIKEAEKGGT